MKNIKELCHLFWSIESTVFKSKENFKPYWHMVRMRAYYHVAQKIGLISNPHPYKRNYIWAISYFIKVMFSSVFNIFKLNKLFSAEKLVFEHPRTMGVKNAHIDIYSHYFIETSISKGEKVLVMSRTLNGSLEKDDDFTRFNIDLIENMRSILGVFAGKIDFFSLGKSDEFYSAASKVLDKHTSKDIKRITRSGFVEYYFSYFAYRIIFLFCFRLNEVVLVDGYNSKAGVINAARKNKKNIKITELQHGVITKFHLGYSYIHDLYDEASLPDKIFVWNDFWLKSVSKFCPIDTKVIQNQYFEDNIKRFENVEKQKNTVLVISQGAISESIALKILESLDKLADFKVYYKLHPSEYSTWKDSDVMKTLANRDIEFLEKVDLYEYFAKCEFVVGVFSTALFEAIEINCKLVLVDLPGIEYWEDMGIDYILFDEWVYDL